MTKAFFPLGKVLACFSQECGLTLKLLIRQNTPDYCRRGEL
jgi:hypothetical protein